MLWYDKVDRELGDMPNYRLEQLERDFDPAQLRGRDPAKVEKELQLALRAGNELARRRNETKRKAEQADADRRIAERDAAHIAAEKATYLRQARASFPGSDAEFAAVADQMWQQHQIERARAAMDNRAARIRRAIGEVF